MVALTFDPEKCCWVFFPRLHWLCIPETGMYFKDLQEFFDSKFQSDLLYATMAVGESCSHSCRKDTLRRSPAFRDTTSADQ